MNRVISDERLRLERILAERLDDTTIAGLENVAPLPGERHRFAAPMVFMR